MINFNAVDFSACLSKEVKRFFQMMLSVESHV